MTTLTQTQKERIAPALVPVYAVMLYQFHSPAVTRATELYEAYPNEEPSLEKLITLVDHPSWPLRLPFDMACLYLARAIQKHGVDARKHIDKALEVLP